MNLPFSTHWPNHMPNHMAGKLTLFPDKILESLKEVVDFYYYDYHCGELPLGIKPWDDIPDVEVIKPKIHTIRPGGRWKPGIMIDFFFWTGKPYRSPHCKFAPRVPVKSVQSIGIYWSEKKFENGSILKRVEVGIDDYTLEDAVWIDGKLQHYAYWFEKLAENDGFDSIEDFFAWFNEDFTGKIIHWTDFKY